MKNADKCGHCDLHNHEMKDCKFLGQSKCGICNWFGHSTEDCYFKKAKDLKHKGEKEDRKGKKKKKKTKEEMNQGEEVEEEDEDEHITFSINESLKITFDESDVNNSSEYNPCLIYYDWLGDSATTSHVCNRHEAFKTFYPLTDTTVSGVGNVKTEAKGQGTVELKS